MQNLTRVSQSHAKASLGHPDTVVSFFTLMNQMAPVTAQFQEHIAPQRVRCAHITPRTIDSISPWCFLKYHLALIYIPVRNRHDASRIVLKERSICFTIKCGENSASSSIETMLLENVARAFEAEEVGGGDASLREAELLQKIGELTVDRDFLSRGLGRLR
jgi:hypothetical protein